MRKIIVVLVILLMAMVTCYYAFPEQVTNFLISLQRSSAGLIQKEIKIKDHNIVYLEGGSGPTILLLHGYTADKDNWLPMAFFLKGYHLIIPDIPGYGDSTKLFSASYDPASQVERLHEFTRAIGIRNFHIAGNSMGGWFAGLFAARYPDEIISLGLFDAAGVRSLKKSPVSVMLEKGENPLLLKDKDDFPRLLSLVFVHPPRFPYPVKKAFIQKRLKNRKFEEKAATDFIGDFSLEKELDKIKAPSLILWGDQDKILDISSVPVFEKGLKDHKTVIIPDCGHAPMIEKTQETAAAYLNFIRSIEFDSGIEQQSQIK